MSLYLLGKQISVSVSPTLFYVTVISLVVFASFARQGRLEKYWLEKSMPSLGKVVDCPSIIFLICCTFLAYFAAIHLCPENILSGSPKWIDSESLAIKIANLRGTTPDNLGTDDLKLLEFISNRRGRSLYANYGPSALLDCGWCHPDAVWTYSLFNLPCMSLPYLLAYALLGFSATGHITQGSFFLRLLIASSLFAIALADMIITVNGTDPVNLITKTKTDSRLLFWTMHYWRYAALSLLCIALALLQFLHMKVSSTQNIFPAEKYILEIQRKVAELSQVTKAGIVINKTIKSSPDLLEAEAIYWKKQALLRQILDTDSIEHL